MSTMLLRGATLVSILLFGLMAGFFYAFSVTVMPGLDQAGADHAVAAMQGINRAVRNGTFFVTFFGSPVLALGLALWMKVNGHARPALWMLSAGLVYFAGVIAPTTGVNVPMNEALAAYSFAADSGPDTWQAYSQRWTFWNTLRTFPPLLSLLLACLAFAGMSRRQG